MVLHRQRDATLRPIANLNAVDRIAGSLARLQAMPISALRR
jgi:hypothetical protein